MDDIAVLLCHLNNVGFQQLVSGHLESAQTVFAMAIRAAKALVDCADRDRHWFAGEEWPPESETSPLESLVQSCIINIRGGKEEYDVTDGESTFASSQHDGAFVYRRAFKLRHDKRIPPLGTICNVILYNMGITFHLEAMATCSQQTLQQAITFYKIVLSKWDREESREDSCIVNNWQSSIPPVLCLAILNNLGESYFRLGHYDKLTSTQAHMKEWYARAVLGGPFLNEFEKLGLLMNLLLLKKPDIAAAA